MRKRQRVELSMVFENLLYEIASRNRKMFGKALSFLHNVFSSCEIFELSAFKMKFIKNAMYFVH